MSENGLPVWIPWILILLNLSLGLICVYMEGDRLVIMSCGLAAGFSIGTQLALGGISQ